MIRGMRTLCAGVAVVMATGITAWACSDYFDQPTYALAKTEYDEQGNGAVLTPGNDTRVNLLLLLADRAPLAQPEATTGTPYVFFSWPTLAERAGGDSRTGDGEGTRCQSNAQGTGDFVTAVNAAKIARDEAAALIAARLSLKPDCVAAGSVPPIAVKSPQALDFAAYLEGARSFYAGEFGGATARFAGLANAKNAWVRETALYMLARTALNRAQAGIVDEYGSVVESGKRDRAAGLAAASALEAYLQRYPRGRYAASAQGLLRRAYWAGGDDAQLAAAYARTIEARDAGADAALVQEIDQKLPPGFAGTQTNSPLLLAVADLRRMRDGDGRVDRGEIERQRPQFGSETRLYDYVRASEALFVRRQARDVLALIPDETARPQPGTLAFSRQMLRGFALDATSDRNARGFWLSMLPLARLPYQRGAVELALALHDERAGQIERVFEAGSPVRNPLIRQILIAYTAGPELLRARAADAASPQAERDAALYILLSKQLLRGFYAGFLADLPRVPASAPADGNVPDPAEETVETAAYGSPQPVPLGVFRTAASGEFACPALRETVTRLAGAPRAARPRLCLAEFVRLKNFDGFGFDKPLEGNGLASSRPQFPGTPYARLEVYKQVMADPAAGADERAFALFRAVQCYGPSGYNHCDGIDVPQGQRRAWFQRLKREFPQSRWAQALKYYW